MRALRYTSQPWRALLKIRGGKRTFSSCATVLQQTASFTSHNGTITTRTGQTVACSVIDAVLRRRMYYTPSFEIYGGSSGFYDLGPPGSALQANLITAWREQFILQEDMLEVDCPAVTPEAILKTSGHVDKFADWMCKDLQTGKIFRTDHVIGEELERRIQQSRFSNEEGREASKREAPDKTADDATTELAEVLAKLDDLDGPALGALMQKYHIKSPTSGGDLSDPMPLNLMFETTIGPGGGVTGFLRPETAQGHFTNFAKLLEFNHNRMPFASASIGKAFRNEISPRSGLLRVREFLLAEIEHFIDPSGNKQHLRFNEVKDEELALLDRQSQLSGNVSTQRMTIETAVTNGLVDNETLGYFLARIKQFLVKVGIEPTKLRFRQHMPNEMAHYATDCWDAEILSSYGWIECVGCADRSAYDLTQHATETGAALSVREHLPEPQQVEEWYIDIDMKKFGPRFRKDARAVKRALMQLSQEHRDVMQNELAQKGASMLKVPSIARGGVEIDVDLVKIEKRLHVEHIREYTPNVIEPSFGMGRILYCLMEHSYWTREGTEERTVMSFPPQIAPTKVALLPLSNHPDFTTALRKLRIKLRQMLISSRIDDSSTSIGKRYARNDELGTPFGITVDFQTLQDGTITLRDRDTMKQVRADEHTICDAIKSLTDGIKTWTEISQELPSFHGQELEH